MDDRDAAEMRQKETIEEEEAERRRQMRRRRIGAPGVAARRDVTTCVGVEGM